MTRFPNLTTKRFTAMTTDPAWYEVCSNLRPAMSGFTEDTNDLGTVFELQIDWRLAPGTLLAVPTQVVYGDLGERAQSMFGYQEFDAAIQQIRSQTSRTFWSKRVAEKTLPVSLLLAAAAPAGLYYVDEQMWNWVDSLELSQPIVIACLAGPALLVIVVWLMCALFLDERTLVARAALRIQRRVLDPLNKLLGSTGKVLTVYPASVPRWEARAPWSWPRETTGLAIFLVLGDGQPIDPRYWQGQPQLVGQEPAPESGAYEGESAFQGRLPVPQAGAGLNNFQPAAFGSDSAQAFHGYGPAPGAYQAPPSNGVQAQLDQSHQRPEYNEFTAPQDWNNAGQRGRGPGRVGIGAEQASANQPGFPPNVSPDKRGKPPPPPVPPPQSPMREMSWVRRSLSWFPQRRRREELPEPKRFDATRPRNAQPAQTYPLGAAGAGPAQRAAHEFAMQKQAPQPGLISGWLASLPRPNNLLASLPRGNVFARLRKGADPADLFRVRPGTAPTPEIHVAHASPNGLHVVPSSLDAGRAQHHHPMNEKRKKHKKGHKRNNSSDDVRSSSASTEATSEAIDELI